MKTHYSMIAHWSQADNKYVAFVPELPGCFADGETLEEVAREIGNTVKDWVETAQELGMDIPSPALYEENKNVARPFKGKNLAKVYFFSKDKSIGKVRPERRREVT
jgi:predicted RNase H-like HicB family nuclease